MSGNRHFSLFKIVSYWVIIPGFSGMMLSQLVMWCSCRSEKGLSMEHSQVRVLRVQRLGFGFPKICSFSMIPIKLSVSSAINRLELPLTKTVYIHWMKTRLDQEVDGTSYFNNGSRIFKANITLINQIRHLSAHSGPENTFPKTAHATPKTNLTRMYKGQELFCQCIWDHQARTAENQFPFDNQFQSKLKKKKDAARTHNYEQN